MEGGMFLLLCLLAFLIGTRAQKSRAGKLSPKAIKQREKIKLFLVWASFGLILFILVMYAPLVVEKILIAMDTRFDWDTLLSVGILAFGIFTLITIYKAIGKLRKSKL